MSRHAIKQVLRRLGFDLRRYDPSATYISRRAQQMQAHGIDLVIDVGGHAGEFASSLRHEGYRGSILSFEPQVELFSRLREAAKDDSLWECRNQAVGASRASITLQLSGNDGFSSSLREMSPLHQEAEPESRFVASEEVEVITLDEAIGDLVRDHESTMLKVDTQGYEAEVVAGAESVLGSCGLVELELVLAELYEGQAQYGELVELMGSKGFVLNDVEAGFRDPRSSQLLQIDGLFLRNNDR